MKNIQILKINVFFTKYSFRIKGIDVISSLLKYCFMPCTYLVNFAKPRNSMLFSVYSFDN